jgi:beta-galactosidase
MIERHIGKGVLAYLGAVLDPVLMRSTVDAMAKDAGVTATFGLVPKGVEVCRRVGEGHEVFIVINHNRSAALIHLPAGMHKVLGDGTAGSEPNSVELPTEGVLVLDRPDSHA